MTDPLVISIEIQLFEEINWEISRLAVTEEKRLERRIFQAVAMQRNGVSTLRDISRRISDIIFPVYFCNVAEKRARGERGG